MDTPPPPDSVDVIAQWLTMVFPSVLVLAFAFAGHALGRLVVGVTR